MVLILQFVEIDPMFITSQMAWSVKYLPAVQETRIQPLGQKDPLEKEMATHSSILAYEMPWTEEPGRLQRVTT